MITSLTASRSRLIVGVFVLLGLVLGYCFLFSGVESEKGEALAVDVRLAPVRYGALAETVELTGTLYGQEEADISAKVSGRLASNKVDLGDRVAPGSLLAQIEDVDYQLAKEERRMALKEAVSKLGLLEVPLEDFDVKKTPLVARAMVQAENAKVRLQRAKQLRTQQPPLISEQDFEDIETAARVFVRDYEVSVSEARAQLALVRQRAFELQIAEEKLKDSALRAPGVSSLERLSDGAKLGEASIIDTRASLSESGEAVLPIYAVAARLKSPGEYVREGDVLFRLVLDNPLKLKARVPERYVSKVAVGQSVLIESESNAQPARGKVVRVSPAVAAESRTFEIEIEVNNDERKLRPGSFAKARLTVGQVGDTAFVPPSALVTFAGVERVFSVESGRALEHIVTSGEKIGGEIAVLRGLPKLTQVVSQGAEQLSSGQAVRVLDTDGGD